MWNSEVEKLIRVIALIDDDLRKVLFRAIVKSVQFSISMSETEHLRSSMVGQKENRDKLQKIVADDPLASMLAANPNLTEEEARKNFDVSDIEFLTKLEHSTKKL